MFGVKTYIKKTAPRVWVRLTYWPARARNHFKTLPHSDKEILVTLGDKRTNEDIPRHLYSIFNFLAEAGYNIQIYQKLDFQFYDWLKPYGRQMMLLERLKFVSRIPEDTASTVYMFDHEDLDGSLLKRRWKKLVYLSVLKPASWQAGESRMHLPFVMYPGIKRSNRREDLQRYRSAARRITVFFGGSMSRIYYKNPALKKYGQMTRRQAAGALLRARKNIIYLPSKRRFYGLIRGNTYHNRCVILNFSKFKIHKENWMEALSKSDFFLCFSGTGYPMCHNLIESLAVGTIPILSYPDLLDVPLENGKNALIYRNASELLQRFDEAMNMSRARIQEMREQVIRYYDEHFSPRLFSDRFESMTRPHTLSLHHWLRRDDPGPDDLVRLDRLNARLAEYSREYANAK